MAELKEILRKRKLSTVGNKCELLNRLSTYDSDIYDITINKTCQPTRDTDPPRDIEEDDRSREESIDDERDRYRDAVTTDAHASVNDLIRRENELLKHEMEITKQKEYQSAPRLNAGKYNAPRVNTSKSVRAVRDLLSEFNGSEGTFWKWEQVPLLRVIYTLDDDATKILVSSKLKGRTFKWFHSKPDYFILSVKDLLTKMKEMFDLSQSKMLLLKKFEKRAWKTDESFTDYYHDKIILANHVPIADDEIVDYVIDDISNRNLQDQAHYAI